jgi:predicted aspartyl protease
MKIRLRDGLPYVTVALTYRNRQLRLDSVLLDTGSAGSVFSVDKALTLGLQYEAEDAVHRIRGVGGSEFVFTKRVDQLALGELQAHHFEIEIGAMGYGFEVDGLVGMDFLTQVGAVIDLNRLEVYPSLSV